MPRLYDEMPAGVDPLGSANKINLATGPLNMSNVPGGGLIMVCFKSPLTGVWGESRVGGDFNVCEGIAARDDFLPERVRSQPAFGKYADELAVVTRDMEGMLTEYYAARGWDPVTGAPKEEKLDELGLEWGG